MPKVSNTDKLSHIRMKKTVKILDTPELSVNIADLALTAVTLEVNSRDFELVVTLDTNHHFVKKKLFASRTSYVNPRGI